MKFIKKAAAGAKSRAKVYPKYSVIRHSEFKQAKNLKKLDKVKLVEKVVEQKMEPVQNVEMK